MAEARLQDEDVETGGVSTDEEFVTAVYMLEGKYFSISKDSQETIKMLTDQNREALPDTGQKTTDTKKIIDRVQTLMSTNFRDTKGTKRLKDKVKGLRTNLRRRITELNQRVLSMVEIQDPTGDGVEDIISSLNEATVELQKLLVDEAALTLILRRDMPPDEAIPDAVKRKDRIDAKSLIQQARDWVGKFGPGGDNPRGRLQVLGSAGVTEIDDEYDTLVAKHTEDDDQPERIAMQEVQGPARRVISPEPSKRPVIASTPHNQNAPPLSPQAITRIERAVTFRMGGSTDENAPAGRETTAKPRVRDPTGTKPTLRAHEEQKAPEPKSDGITIISKRPCRFRRYRVSHGKRSDPEISSSRRWRHRIHTGRQEPLKQLGYPV